MKNKIKKISCSAAILSIILSLTINIVLYCVDNNYNTIFCRYMPKDTKIIDFSISDYGNFIDDNNVLWKSGIKHFNAIKIADNILAASDDFYITLNNELWAWNKIPHMVGASNNEIEEEPVFIMNNVVEACDLSKCLLIKEKNGNLILLGEDTFASGNKYTIDNSLLVFQDAASFCCIENYMDNDSVYVIDQSDRLYAMGSNRHGQLGFEDISALNEFRLLDEDVIKIDGVENQMYYLKNNGDLYAWGNYGGSNIPTKYLMNISDFSGGNILICIDNNGTIYKYRNDKIVDTLSGPEVKKVSVSLGITALLTKDGRVLLSGEENHNGIIPTNKMSVDFKKPVVLQENTIFNLYVFLFKYGFAIIGLLIILLLISGEYINKSAVTVGYSHTAPTPKFEQTLKDNGFVFEVLFARDLPAPKAKREREKTHKYVCPICGQEVKSTADLNLICGECEVPMERLD